MWLVSAESFPSSRAPLDPLHPLAPQDTLDTFAPAQTVAGHTAQPSTESTPNRPIQDSPEVRPSVALREAVVVLGSFPALSGCSFTVRPGEVALLRGPNGSGKTTVLKVCAGLVPLTAGRVVVLGRDLDKHNGRNRRAIRGDVGFLSHAGFLYEDLTVADNVRFAIRASGGNPSAAAKAMDRVGVDSRVAALPVHACSAGQRRRASLAAVVARAPKLWLLDEPHTGLDAQTRDLLDELIREAASAGSTVILASHDDDRAAALASRTLHLSGGHVVHETMGTATYGLGPAQTPQPNPVSPSDSVANAARPASSPNVPAQAPSWVVSS